MSYPEKMYPQLIEDKVNEILDFCYKNRSHCKVYFTHDYNDEKSIKLEYEIKKDSDIFAIICCFDTGEVIFELESSDDDDLNISFECQLQTIYYLVKETLFSIKSKNNEADCNDYDDIKCLAKIAKEIKRTKSKKNKKREYDDDD